MAIKSKNKKVKVRPVLYLDHSLKDSPRMLPSDQGFWKIFQEPLVSKLNDIFWQVLPSSLSAEEKELIRNHKINKSEVKKLVQERINPSFLKVFMPKKLTKRLLDYLLKLYKFHQDGGIRFTRKDSDGIERDYYGFPLTMDIKKRKTFLSGPSNRDNYAKSIGLNSRIDQSTKLRNKADGKEARQVIRKNYAEMRKKNPEMPVKNLFEEIRDLIKRGKIRYPRNKIPSVSTLQRIVYSNPKK